MCFLKLQPEAGTCRDPLQNKGWKAPFPPSFFSFSSLFSVRAIFMLSICCAPGLLQGSFYWTLVSQYLHLVSQFGGMLPRGCPSISWLRRPGGGMHPGFHGAVTNRQFLADSSSTSPLHPGPAQIAHRNTPPVFLRRGLFVSLGSLAWWVGRLLVWHASRSLWRYSQGIVRTNTFSKVVGYKINI